MFRNIFIKNSKLFNLLTLLKKRPYKYLYKNIIPKHFRTKLDEISDYHQQEFIAQCWQILIDNYEQIEKFVVKPKKEFSHQKIIWQYWGQGWNYNELPEVVKISLHSIDKYKDDYLVIRLDNNNIDQYLEFPQFVLDKIGKNDFRLVFFSDLLRIALLNAYGGIWMDATIVLTDTVPDELKNMPYFCFQRDDSESLDVKKEWSQKNKEYFSWNNKFYVRFLSSFMIAKKNNLVINYLLNLMLFFWKTQDSIPHYFFFQILYEKLITGVMKEYQCEIKSDILPHLLAFKIYDDFNEDEFKSIKDKIGVHKLTYVNDYTQKSYFSYLKQLYKID